MRTVLLAVLLAVTSCDSRATTSPSASAAGLKSSTSSCALMRTANTNLASWNEGPAKQAIIDFVRRTTDPKSPELVPPAERIATFDQDGTLWVEHPLYTQVVYSLEREGKTATGMSGSDMIKATEATMIGTEVDAFEADAASWIATARDARFKQRYTDLVYQPMLELMNYLRAHGYKTFIVTGGGQDFVRAFAEHTYGVPPEQVIGTAAETNFAYDPVGKPELTTIPKMLLVDDRGGKPEGIHLVIGRRPLAAFGNSTGDQQMLEYTGAGDGPRLMMLVLHDDATREYAYGPARGLPDSKIGTFSQALDDEARQRGWTVVSMKADWKKIFCFD